MSCTRLDRLTGSARSDTLAADLSYAAEGVEATRALRAPSARLVPGYVAMCSTWPQASAQRPFVVVRMAGWGLPLIPGQLFISKGRGRAKKTEEKDKQKKREGSRGKKVNLCCQLLEKHQGLFCFSVCVKRKKRKERRGGKRRDSCLMAWLSVSWKIVASQGEAEADLQEVIKGGESCLSGC